jgi:hypothetical protein
MRMLLFGLLFCSVVFCQAQDPAFTDMRTQRENFTHQSDKDVRRDLTAFTLGGIGESVNKPVLKKLPVTKEGNDFITFDSNKLQVTIRAGVFNSAKHKLQYDGKYLIRIDNKPYFGNYSIVPRISIAAVTVVSGKDTIAIPPSAYADLYNPQFTYQDGSGVLRSQDGVYLSDDKRRIYIYMLNKDEQGSYEVTWIIQDNKYLKRVIDFGFTK